MKTIPLTKGKVIRECSIVGCTREGKRGHGLCSIHYDRKRLRLKTQCLGSFFNRTILERLEEKKKITSTGCWEWTGSKNIGGYGMAGYNGKDYVCSRLSAHHYLGFDLGSNLLICHHCDNRACFNPDHLFVGTYLDNAQDRDKKGRGYDRNGEKNGRAKINATNVKSIRTMHPEKSIGFLAKKFGLGKSQIRRIIHNQTWKHLP